MPTSYSDPAVVGAIAAIAAVTFAIRFSFIALFGRLDEIPPRVRRVLRYVPPAVLAALVLPSIVAVDPASGTLAVDRLFAGALAGVVAWRTEDVFATIAVGMGALWTVRLLFF
ncbi:AzlD domain-containing protein [Halomicrobium urmianum]|uniref:AzlD domain-containing protein n=1 Tax=Halomicrobium urmianum TaxID=1586233 RepID=UPI001CDA02A5|nr:AzlD domain-containing protein [Halomicrobium urmianum]